MAALLASSAACGDGATSNRGSTSAAPPTVSDSAGVTIVENHAPAWGPGDGWRLDTLPEVTIGAIDGPPEYTFAAPVPYLLHDGRILVADLGAQELRYYSASGEHLRTAGRAGSGPGEFESLSAAAVMDGDSVLAFDRRLAKVSLFDPAGGFVRDVKLQRSAASPALQFLGLISSSVWAIATELAGPESGDAYQRFLEVSLYGSDGNRTAILDTLIARRALHRPVPPSNTYLDVGLPFAARGVATAANGRMYLTQGDQFEVRVLSSTGSLERLIRLDRPLRKVTATDIDNHMASIEEQFERFAIPDAYRPASRDVNRDAAGRSEHMPAIRALKVTPDGHILVTPWAPAWEPQPDALVFDEAGRWLGELKAPEKLYIADFGPDFVIATWLDELEVSYVGRFRLHRGTQ
ncbi:MAG: hypothetical protein ACR2GQ_05660 [Gemmatimonadota bacterium]